MKKSSKPIDSSHETNDARPIRVAVYCRITDNDDQFEREHQEAYYNSRIADDPNWMMAGIFIDIVTAKTRTTMLPEFKKMMRKCERGKIDLILTQSFIQFGISVSDCITQSQKLKDLGIAVIFENDGINTLSPDFNIATDLWSEFVRRISESLPPPWACTMYGFRPQPISEKEGGSSI